MSDYRLVLAAPANPDLRLLTERLDRDLLERYPADEIFGLDFEDPSIDEVVFVIAYDGEQPVGCGAIRPLDDSSAELKRFYVESSHRKRGIAARIFRFLEKTAVERGYRILRLEAGWEQPEAIRFYRKQGFCEIVRYGEYTGCESSVCFEKDMGSGDASYPIGPFKHEGIITEEQRAVWIREIESLPLKLAMAVEDLSDSQLDTPYREGGWTIRQVVHHLADSHMNSMIRFKLALTEENPTVKPYAEDRWAMLEDSRQLPILPSLLLLESLHLRWTCLLRSLRAEDYERTFYHPESKQSNRLAHALGVYAWHGNHHVAHIRSLRERMGW